MINRTIYLVAGIGPVLFPAKKYPDGQFYAEEENDQQKLISIPEFLVDETAPATKEECLGVFADSIDSDKLFLQIVNCSTKSLAYFTTNKTEELTNIGMPVLPCYVPPNETTQLNQTRRKKRSSGML